MKKGVDFIDAAVGAIIVNTDRKIFLARRSGKSNNELGRWSIPGSGVEFGEIISAAAVRETREEHGFVIAVVEELCAMNHIIPDKKPAPGHFHAPLYAWGK